MTDKFRNLVAPAKKRLLQTALQAKAGLLLFGLLTLPVFAQMTNNPFSDRIEANEDIIAVGYKEFAILPDIDGEAALAMDLESEPEGDRYFVNDLHGLLYTVKDGGEVTKSLT